VRLRGTTDHWLTVRICAVGLPSIPRYLLSIAPRWLLPPFTPNLNLSALPAQSRKKLLDFLI
jgi:hypothetical protein